MPTVATIGFSRSGCVLVGLVRREHQHHDRVGCSDLGEDFLGGLEPADARQVHVHEHEVWPQLAGRCDRVLAGLHLADHLEAIGELDDGSRDVAERGLIIDDQHSNAHLIAPTLPRYRGCEAQASVLTPLCG